MANTVDQQDHDRRSSYNTTSKKELLASATSSAAEQIKALSRLTVKATNRRDFGLDSPGWSHCVSDELYRIDGVPTPLAEHLQRMRQMATDNPDIHVRLLFQDVVVTACVTSADMFEMIELCSSGSIKTLQAMRTGWRCREGKWWCSSCTLTRGLGVE